MRSGWRILKSLYAGRIRRGGRGLAVCRRRPVGHAFGHRAAAAWPRASVSGRSSAGPADVAVTGYGYGFVKNYGLGYDCGLRLWATVEALATIVCYDCGLRLRVRVLATVLGYVLGDVFGRRLWASIVGYGCWLQLCMTFLATFLGYGVW